MRLAFLLILCFVAGLAGCTIEGETYRLDGAFNKDRTDADIAAFHATVAPYNSDVAIMESFPEQFAIRGLDLPGCNSLRAALLEKDYIGFVGGCVTETVQY